MIDKKFTCLTCLKYFTEPYGGFCPLCGSDNIRLSRKKHSKYKTQYHLFPNSNKG